MPTPYTVTTPARSITSERVTATLARASRARVNRPASNATPSPTIGDGTDYVVLERVADGSFEERTRVCYEAMAYAIVARDFPAGNARVFPTTTPYVNHRQAGLDYLAMCAANNPPAEQE